MKKVLSFFLALAVLFCFAGCDLAEKDSSDFDVEECLEEAQELIEEGDLEAAEKVLKRGIRKAEDTEALEACLLMVQAMLEQTESQTGSTSATGETSEAVTEATAEATTEATTEAPTEATTEATYPVSSGNLLDGFTKDQTYQINVFLSNFSEQNFQNYPCSTYQMVNFGFKYAKVNNREVFHSKDGYYYVNVGDMDSILTRFFGTTVNLTQPTSLTGPYNEVIECRDGGYYRPMADGDSVAYCTAATFMRHNGDGTYTVSFDIYAHVNPHDSMSPYYSMTANQMAASSDLRYQQSGTAVVKDYTRSNGVKSYQLISYDLY